MKMMTTTTLKKEATRRKKFKKDPQGVKTGQTSRSFFFPPRLRFPGIQAEGIRGEKRKRDPEDEGEEEED
ncbi:hypothetical protein llap_22018 [Limosa lapponica baueri]|uniref:Uncharacterized protein n=1 Tax=Limosa lapponica baueri TaxID=1758121 RepID=A0A2I0T1K7_LIMLA|nr:hypothetical protein llap_22018 [Limosa lapponica baueri]